MRGRAPAAPIDLKRTLLQEHVLEEIARMGEEDWVTVTSIPEGFENRVIVHCALIPKTHGPEALKTFDWELQGGSGGPGIISTNRGDGGWDTRYYLHGNSEGVEPLVVQRDWHGARPWTLELTEEFRLFHNLHEDKPRLFVKIEANGETREVARVAAREVRVRVRELKEFLATKGMTLVLLFSTSFRHDGPNPEALGLKHDERLLYARDDVVFEVHTMDTMKFLHDREGTGSYGRGKKLIRGYDDPPEDWGGPPRDEYYPEFIIGTKGGQPVTFTCDPERLANFFGKNVGAPNYVTPVHFRRDVLKRYYDKPDLFTVEDGYLRCAGLWGLRIDNNHEKHVIVLLGDLGRDLPEAERDYWRTFNVAPEGGVSDVAWRRGFEAQFADPERPDLVFKQRFEESQSVWQKTRGWVLWKPLAPGDQHHYTTLRIPLVENQAEFDAQTLSLSKVIIESLNERRLAEGIELPPTTQGIGKLEAYLKRGRVPGYEPHILFLRRLWKLRLGAGHRKGDDYEAAARHFQVHERGFAKAFEEILREATTLVEFLSRQAAAQPGGPVTTKSEASRPAKS